jgi:hypothetical protein
MWFRTLLLISALGCVASSEAVEDLTGTTTQRLTTDFECLNTGDLHVVECQGSISLFPITITIEHLHVLSGNELTILSGDLNDLADLDGNILDHNEILNDVEALVLDDFADKFDVDVTGNDVVVCTLVLGGQLCR